MFGVGLFEVLIIALAALVFLGSDRLPELARQLGKYFVQFRRITSDVRAGIEDAIKQAEHDLLLEEKEKIRKLLAETQTKAIQEARALMEPSNTERAQNSASEAIDAKWEEEKES